MGGELGANSHLAQPLRPFLSFDKLLPVLESVIKLYIEHASRKNWATSKLKFLLEGWGMRQFSQEFEKYFVKILPDFQTVPLPKRTLPVLNKPLKITKTGV